VAGTPYPVSELGEVSVPGAEFGWNRNSVQIDFSAIAFQSPDQLTYQFRLEGAEGGWSEPTPDSTVHFSNLAPGRYRFLVRAINSDGAASPAPAAFPFTISPPPWLRWWFQAGIAGMVLGLGYLGHKLRLERQLAMARVRSGIATDLHDDIGASLSRIAVMTEVVKDRVGKADRDSQRMLGEIAETSRMLVDGMSDIVWSIDPRHDNLADVVARLRAFGSDVLEPRGIHWTCEGPSDALNRALSPDQRRQLYLVFKEAIHNIARHSHAQNVTLRFRVDGDRVWGEIQDDGRGVPANPSGGLGLGSMRQRAERLGGEFQIGAGPEGGTRATLDFPLSSRNA
jgi:two-component sensor histidine kinase